MDGKEATGEELLKSDLFGSGQRRSVANRQDLTLGGLMSRARSVSYLPSSGSRFTEMARELNEVFERFSVGGHVVLHYKTIAYTARKE